MVCHHFCEVYMITRSTSIKRKLLAKPYPENLILTVVCGNIESIEITPDILAGLEYALSTLTDIQREVLKLRFKQHMTYEKIGEMRERSLNSARNIEVTAMHKLRRLPLIGYILYGKVGFAEMEYSFHWPWESPPPKKDPLNTNVLIIPFEELNLTIRTFNTLRSAGYKCVGDIVKLSYEQILGMKFYSRKNYKEIAWKLWELGLQDTCWKYFM